MHDGLAPLRQDLERIGRAADAAATAGVGSSLKLLLCAACPFCARESVGEGVAAVDATSPQASASGELARASELVFALYGGDAVL